MKEQLAELIHGVQNRFGLFAYYLGRHHYYYEGNSGKTSYLLSMEWFPNDHEETDEDLNPTGTASIAIDIHTKVIKSIVFTNKTSYEEDGDFPAPSFESVMEWVETLTDLTFGKQFQLVSEEDGAFSFQAVVDNIPIYPPGEIHVEFNEENKLCSFYTGGAFPQEEEVEWEPFSLTPENADNTAKNQCVLTQIPNDQEEKMVPVYAIEEVFLANDGLTIIPYEVSTQEQTVIRKNVRMKWDYPIDQSFTGEDLEFSREVSEETALLNEPHSDTYPITELEQAECTEAVRNFLRQVYPDASGEWILKGLYRDNGNIHATLRLVKRDHHIFPRKLTLILNKEQYNVVNYVDNIMMQEMFSDFQAAESAVITQEEAYQKIREYITVTPRYVYSNAQKSYILCGKIDCIYGVHAVTGEVIPLDDL